MARSKKQSVTIPHPVIDGLKHQLDKGILDYPSANAAILGLCRYQLIVGKPHSVTGAIARMHPAEQDCIDDFLLELTQRGKNLRGTFLRHVAERAAAGVNEPTPEEIEQLTAEKILHLARRFQSGDETLWDEIPS